MFTGIVSHIGKVNKISRPDDWELLVDVINDNNLDSSFNINSTAIGASISCSGICLTLKKILNNTLYFDVCKIFNQKYFKIKKRNIKNGAMTNKLEAIIYAMKFNLLKDFFKILASSTSNHESKIVA